MKQQIIKIRFLSSYKTPNVDFFHKVWYIYYNGVKEMQNTNVPVRKKKKSIEEFSKLLLRMIVGLTMVIIFFCIFFCFKFETTEPLTYLVPSVFTELAAGTGFYYWKAKSENKIKITLGAIDDLRQKEDLTENEVRIMEALINSLG